VGKNFSNPKRPVLIGYVGMKSEQAKQALEVSVVSDDQEKAWFDQRLADHHYLGAGKSVGDYIAVYDQEKGTQRCEQTAACQLLDGIERLDNKIITADPLQAQKKTARKIVEKGGDYLFQIKENQPGLLRQAKQFDALKGTPFLNTSRPGAAKSKTAP
jgi:hypothetical protein